MRRIKSEMRLTNEKISELSHIPLATVKKVMGGSTKSPRYRTMMALEKVFLQNRSGETVYTRVLPEESALMRETPFEYGNHTDCQRDSSAKNFLTSHPLLPHKRQGEYTEEDRDLLPDDYRTELIDGILFDLAAPIPVHQLISTEILFQIRSQIEKCGKDCLVFAAPSDVKISDDNRNILQPDIYIICDTKMIENKKQTIGPPPFIIEILSPSSRGKDVLLKSWKYASSGVREYWMVDPEKKCVTVKDFEKDPQGTESVEYTFEDVIPVGISGGHCSIKFKPILDLINRIGL